MTDSQIKVSLAFTRYLYQMLEVKQSLFIALIDHNPEEALYWAYELYYSGFEEELYEYIILIYETLYKTLHPSLNDHIKGCYVRWLEMGSTSDANIDVGSIIYTLSLRPFCLISFARTYLRVNITLCDDSPVHTSNFIVTLNTEYIQKYNTYTLDHASCIQPYQVLENVIKYPIKKCYNKVMDTVTYENPLHSFRVKWLYYASFSPIWRERIDQYNGIIDYKNEIVHFNNEDDEEEFRSIWDYEPDEVSQSVTNRCIGTGDEEQMSVKDFCKQFHYTIISRIVKRPTTNT